MKTYDTGIRDNRKRGSVGDFLYSKILPGSELSVVSAYFTIYAYHALREKLDSIEHLRFLFGEPRFIQSLDPEKTEKKAFRIEDDTLSLGNRLEQKRIAQECADWIATKVDIKSIKRPDFLHGKMYHIDNGGVEEAILGSSNFTVRGLGLGDLINNLELNLEVNDNRDRRDLKEWFNELWEDNALTEDVKSDVLRYLEQLYVNHFPEFIYYKTLYHIFENYLAEAEHGGLLDEKTGFFETKTWNMLYGFQKDGVKGAINKILTHNGCIIADSVGLGKTFEALAVIKYFELLNGRVLVLCPKKLRENWTIFKENDERNVLNGDRFNYSVLSHTDLSRQSGRSGDIELSSHNWGNYDLVVIDESHNFRNNAAGKTDDDGERRKSRYEKLMSDILQSGIETKVLLLSATPVNNNLKDLRNQILLLTKNEDRVFTESLNVNSISQSMKNAQTHFSKWADPKKNPDRKTKELISGLGSDFFKLLDALTIARSRKHIQRYYSIDEIGKFPERLKPITLTPDIDLNKRFPSYDKLNVDISNYQLSLFNPSKYLKEEFVVQYQQTDQGKSILYDQGNREHYLIGMMRVNFLKRLESSIESFQITLDRTIKKIEDLEDKIKHFKKNREVYENPELPGINEEDCDDDEEMLELRDRLTVGKKLKFELAHIKIDEWLKDLGSDKDQLISMHNSAISVTPDRDEKLQELKRIINDKVKKPLNANNTKVLVFTAFSDTAEYLYNSINGYLHSELNLNVALITGTGHNKTTFHPEGFKKQTDYFSILTNFSPKSKMRAQMPHMPQKGEIDVLIATDCISEGQNLQDCDFLVNYDIHWNPVRIIQRFGRIDRLASNNDEIQLVNFWPTHDLNKYINLKERVEARMALVDLAATAEDDLLNTDQIKELLSDDLTYRDKQLLRLQDEVLDLEEMDDNISLSEFTLDDFRIDLLNFMKSNEEVLKNTSLGLYAVVPSFTKKEQDPSLGEITKPGVIFCFKHKNQADDMSKNIVNPLNPYYLVYIRDDGEVRFSFTHAKQILTMFQSLCQGKQEPYQELCDLFDKETDNGENMEFYSKLLKKSITAITGGFKKRAVQHMLSGRDGILPKTDEQPGNDNDFELVTWLVIK